MLVLCGFGPGGLGTQPREASGGLRERAPLGLFSHSPILKVKNVPQTFSSPKLLLPLAREGHCKTEGRGEPGHCGAAQHYLQELRKPRGHLASCGPVRLGCLRVWPGAELREAGGAFQRQRRTSLLPESPQPIVVPSGNTRSPGAWWGGGEKEDWGSRKLTWRKRSEDTHPPNAVGEGVGGYLSWRTEPI